MALMGFDDMFGRVDRMMNTMMRSMLGSMPDPYDMINGMMMMPTARPYGYSRYSHHTHHTGPSSLQSYVNINGHDAYSYCSSSVMTMTADEYGRPQVYESTSSRTLNPSGVQETRASVRDSRSGLHQMSIGHHIQDRAHIMQRSRNYYTGEEEHNNEYVNIEEEETPAFEEEWQQKYYPSSHYRNASNQRSILPTSMEITELPSDSADEMLALPAPTPNRSSTPTTSRNTHSSSVQGARERVSPTLRKSKISHKHKHRREKKPYKKP